MHSPRKREVEQGFVATNPLQYPDHTVVARVNFDHSPLPQWVELGLYGESGEWPKFALSMAWGIRYERVWGQQLNLSTSSIFLVIHLEMPFEGMEILTAQKQALAVETHFFSWQQKRKCSIALQRVQKSSSEFSERNRARCHRH